MNSEPVKVSSPSSRKLLSRLNRGFFRMLHNWPWKLLALFLATCLWAGLISQDATLTRERSFSDVMLNVNGADSLRRNSGLIVVSGLEPENLSVRFRVNVPQREYGNVSSANYNPRIDLTRITQPGEQSLKVLTTSSTAYGSVTDLFPSAVTVQVDEYITNYHIPVSIEITGSYPEGFYCAPPTLEPSIVAVSGPASVVGQIARIAVELDVSSLSARAGKVRIAMPMRFLDRDGKDVPGNMLEVSSAGIVLRSILAQQTLFPSRQVPISSLVTLAGTPARGYRMGDITVSPTSVLAAGDEDALDAMEELFADGLVNVEGATASFTQTLRLKKPAGLEYLNPDTVTVQVEIEPVLISRTFDNVKLSARGVSAGLRASLNARTVSLVLTGPQLELELLRAIHLSAYVDATGLEEGEYVLPVCFSVEDGSADAFSLLATPANVVLTLTGT